jgi:hypothetical protein
MEVQRSYLLKLHELESAVVCLRDSLNSLRADTNTPASELAAKLNPRESAEFYLSLATALIKLIQANLRCHGTDDAKHAIQREVIRLQSYILKLTGKCVAGRIDDSENDS